MGIINLIHRERLPKLLCLHKLRRVSCIGLNYRSLSIGTLNLVLIAVWVLGLIEIILRRPDMLLIAQPWAEDCSIFISQALFLGPAAFLRTYEGYYHLVPRLVTAVSIELSIVVAGNIRLAPFFMNLTAVAISSGCVVFFVSSRFSWVARTKWRALTALLIIGMPGVFEIYGSITGIQWWLVYLMFLLTWDCVMQHRRLGVWEFLVLIISAASTPYGVLPAAILVIYYGYEARKEKRIQSLTCLGILSLLFVASIQLFFTFGDRVYGNLDLFNTTRILLIFIGDLIVVTLYVALAKKRKYLEVPLWFFAMFVTATIVVCTCYPPWMFRGPVRYAFVPAAILLTVLVPGLSRLKDTKIKAIIVLLTLCTIIMVEAANFSLPTFVDLNWVSNSLPINPKGNNVCTIPINPRWVCNLPCG